MERWQFAYHVGRFSSCAWFIHIPSKRTFENQKFSGKVDGSGYATVYGTRDVDQCCSCNLIREAVYSGLVVSGQFF
jgi:hypothetical protein